MTPEELQQIVNIGFAKTKKDPKEAVKEAEMTRQELWRIRKGKGSVRRYNQITRLFKFLEIPTKDLPDAK